MEKIEISLGDADDASIEVEKLQTVYGVEDGPQPKKENPTIWRYRTFEQLVEFLSSTKLWFSHVSGFDDPYEAISMKESSLAFSFVDELSGEDQTHSNETYNREYSYGVSYANCWHMNEGESAALWNQYGGEQNAVAIKSTSERLHEVLGAERHRIGFGKMKYGLSGEVKKPVFHKRNDFKYENEYRAVIFKYPHFMSVVASWEDIKQEYKKYNGIHSEPSIVDLMPEGEGIEVDLDELIEAIYVDPTAKNRFVKAVRDVVSKFVDCPVKQSSIFDDPLSEVGE